MSDLARLTGVEIHEADADPLLSAKVTRHQRRLGDGPHPELDRYEWRFSLYQDHEIARLLGWSLAMGRIASDKMVLDAFMSRVPNGFRSAIADDMATMETVITVWATLPQAVECEVVE